MSDEVWKPVVGYESYYEVSSLGKIRSHFGCGRVLKLSPSWKKKYLRVGLWDKEHVKQVGHFVHVLVAEAFIGPRPAGYECAHINGIGTDNRHCNLEWKTHADNEADKERHGTRQRGEAHGSAKLTAADVAHIRTSYEHPYHGLGTSLARKFGVTKGLIYAIKDGRLWKAGTAA